jgi:predicted NBD/HSP70 family sugar kinase
MTARIPLKATHGALRRENKQLLLRSVYLELASSRAELSTHTGLAKPTVSDLVSELLDEGYLEETGLGQSTEEGGKRPRLLRFVPTTRQVIGLSINRSSVYGVLATLDGAAGVEHTRSLVGLRGQEVLGAIQEVIDGLIAQLDSPLLCLSAGVQAEVDERAGTVTLAELGWHKSPLRHTLQRAYGVPVYLADATELAALANYTFHDHDGENLVTVLVDEAVGVGVALDGARYHHGSQIGEMHTATGQTFADILSHSNVRERVEALPRPPILPTLTDADLTWLYLRHALDAGDPAAQTVLDSLAAALAQAIIWASALLHPDRIVLAGAVGEIGDLIVQSILKHVAEGGEQLPDGVALVVDTTPNLAALGAVALALQRELGLV